MTTYMQNYGFTKSVINNNNNKSENEIKWIGEYDGKIATIDVDINNNGNKETINMKLDNHDIMDLLGVPPIEMSLENRLKNDFGLEPNSDLNLQPVLLKESADVPITNGLKSKTRKSINKNKKPIRKNKSVTKKGRKSTRKGRKAK